MGNRAEGGPAEQDLHSVSWQPSQLHCIDKKPTTEHVVAKLEKYRKTWLPLASRPEFVTHPQQSPHLIFEDTLGFVEAHPNCCERDHPTGHITGSALVTNTKLDKVLLTLHHKLNMWLQLGGHADGSPIVEDVAKREAHEESGLERVSFLRYEDVLFPKEGGLQPVPFDLDRHLIPASSKEKEHFHYDVRFLMVADDTIPLAMTDESHDLRWFSLKEAREITQEISMHRQFAKLDFVRSHL